MLSVPYACLICININKYISDHLAIRCTFDKCGAVNLCICIYIYVVIVIVVLGFGYTRSALNIYYCK